VIIKEGTLKKVNGGRKAHWGGDWSSKGKCHTEKKKRGNQGGGIFLYPEPTTKVLGKGAEYQKTK